MKDEWLWDDNVFWVSIGGELAKLEMNRGLCSCLSQGVGYSRVLLFLGKKMTCGH